MGIDEGCFDVSTSKPPLDVKIVFGLVVFLGAVEASKHFHSGGIFPTGSHGVNVQILSYTSYFSQLLLYFVVTNRTSRKF